MFKLINASPSRVQLHLPFTQLLLLLPTPTTRMPTPSSTLEIAEQDGPNTLWTLLLSELLSYRTEKIAVVSFLLYIFLA